MTKLANYKITEEKKYELIDELNRLERKETKEIADRLERAREEDLSEDDIQLGSILEEKELLEKRIEHIEDILEKAEIIEDKNYCEPNKIGLGSSVKLKQDSKIFGVKIVSSLEADPSKQLISDTSPLGVALMNGKEGDTVEILIRGKTTKYKILEIC